MSDFTLESTTDTAVNFYSAERAPVLTVSPGDSVTVHTLDASGHLERQQVPGEARPRQLTGRGHCLVGPIAVEGAMPGQTLAVHMTSLTPDPWGWTVAAAIDNPLNRRLGMIDDVDPKPTHLLWDLDLEKNVGTNQLGISVPLRPFLGVVGLPPEATGEHSTVPPRHDGAGNIDCRELVAGSTLYIPVTVPGALLHVGDGHAVQGDGEVSGTAIECGMTTELRLDIEPQPEVDGVYAITPAGRITFGFDADLNEATAIALDAMLGWMQKLYGITKAEALATASASVSMRVTQIANLTWGVHALLPEGVISKN